MNLRFLCAVVLMLAVLLGGRAVAHAQTSDNFAKANAEYGAGRFQEAIALYQQAIASGETTAALFYNLGNAQYRAGDLGRSILSYERALALEPQHPEAEANLRLVRDKARALELQTNWWDRLTARASSKHYAIAAAVAFWIAAFAMAALVLRRRRSPALVATTILALIIFAGTIAALYGLETGNKGHATAIVVAPKPK